MVPWAEAGTAHTETHCAKRITPESAIANGYAMKGRRNPVTASGCFVSACTVTAKVESEQEEDQAAHGERNRDTEPMLNSPI